jgi:hypothetical protein
VRITIETQGQEAADLGSLLACRADRKEGRKGGPLRSKNEKWKERGTQMTPSATVPFCSRKRKSAKGEDLFLRKNTESENAKRSGPNLG